MMTNKAPHMIPVKHVEPVQPVIVDGVEIPEDAIAEEAKNFNADSRERAAASLVIRQLLLNDIVKREISLETGEEAAIQTLLEQSITLPQADEIACRNYFEKNREQFRSPDLYEVSHILLAAAPHEFEERQAAREKGEDLIEELQAKPHRFAELASKYSACPSKEMAGSLGQITPGSTVPEFERQLFTLEEGLYAHPVESRYGYHIVRVDRKILGQQLDYEIVQERVASKLYRQSQNHAFVQCIEGLIDAADIQGVDIKALRQSLLSNRH